MEDVHYDTRSLSEVFRNTGPTETILRTNLQTWQFNMIFVAPDISVCQIIY
jgi:hypothetical protein